MRPSSVERLEVKNLAEKGVEIRVVDIDGPLDELVKAMTGIDVFISAIDAMGQRAQLQLVAAASQAGVKRFVPCTFITVAPPGGVFQLRDTVHFHSELFLSELTNPISERGGLPRDLEVIRTIHNHRCRLFQRCRPAESTTPPPDPKSKSTPFARSLLENCWKERWSRTSLITKLAMNQVAFSHAYYSICL